MRINIDTVQVSIESPRDVLSALRQDPATFVGEMRLAAAVKWYEMARLTQGKAAEVADSKAPTLQGAFQLAGAAWSGIVSEGEDLPVKAHEQGPWQPAHIT